MTPVTPMRAAARAASPAPAIPRLAERADVRAALAWFLDHREDLLGLQTELVRIAAPPHGEQQRAEWLRSRFAQIGLEGAQIDPVGNVLGLLQGTSEGQLVAVTAHIDTVFPTDTPVEVRREGNRLYGPGISDNGAGVTALVALASSLRAAGIRPDHGVLFVGNVGEEGEGDLRGMRHLFSDPRWKDRIAYTLVLDGASTDTIVTQALGSRRFEVAVRGPGGHSWSDFGTPNPIVILARALARFSETHVPREPKTTLNVGVISGGTSVNSIPESASARIDIRSADVEEIDRLDRALHEAVAAEVGRREARGHRPDALLSYEIKVIGSRPGAELPADARILQVMRAVDAWLGNSSRQHRASTDANIPLSLGREAISIGAGGSGGDAHTLHEWYDSTGRELGLKRVLLATLALAGVSD